MWLHILDTMNSGYKMILKEVRRMQISIEIIQTYSTVTTEIIGEIIIVRK